MIGLDDYPEFQEKKYLLDGANICGIEKDANSKFKLEVLKMVINELKKRGIREENIIAIADASLKYKIDDTKEYKALKNLGKIIEIPAGIIADKVILAYCIEHKDTLFLSNDLMKEFYPYLPDDKFIFERRITIVKIKDEIFLIPMKRFENEQKDKKKLESDNSPINTTIDIFKLIKNTEGEFDIFTNSQKGDERKNGWKK